MNNEIFAVHFAELLAGGFDACEYDVNGQKYVEVRKIPIDGSVWNMAEANILIAVPSNYNIGGLDGFYIEDGLLLANNQAHQRTRHQGVCVILDRNWRIVSWHYQQNKPWSSSDTIVTHVHHCRLFFKQGARKD